MTANPGHRALSYEHAGRIAAQLKAAVADLPAEAEAEAADQADVADGMSIPEEPERRKVRLETLAQARATIEARARDRFEREPAEPPAKLAARQAKTEATGQKPRGKPPPPLEGRLPTDQDNPTDAESRIMPVAGGGFERCDNAPAVVAEGSLPVAAVDVVPAANQAANDKQQLQPMLNRIAALPEVPGQAETLPADNGYFSAANVAACAAAQIAPPIAIGRQPHHPSLDERFAEPPPPPKNPTPVAAMA